MEKSRTLQHQWIITISRKGQGGRLGLPVQLVVVRGYPIKVGAVRVGGGVFVFVGIIICVGVLEGVTGVGVLDGVTGVFVLDGVTGVFVGEGTVFVGVGGIGVFVLVGGIGVFDGVSEGTVAVGDGVLDGVRVEKGMAFKLSTQPLESVTCSPNELAGTCGHAVSWFRKSK